jgi:copper chaperone CopZ
MVDRLNFDFRKKISELITCANACEENIKEINGIINVYNRFALKTHESVGNQDFTLEIEFLVINGHIFEKIDLLGQRFYRVPAEVMSGQDLGCENEVGEMKGKLGN